MRNKESGYTLIGVLAIITILAIFGVSLVTISLSSVKQTKVKHDNQSVFYIAEAGANVTFEKLKENLQEIYTKESIQNEDDFKLALQRNFPWSDKYTKFETVNGDSPIANITVEQVPVGEESYSFKITSKGTIGNESRTVEQLMTLDWQNKQGDENVPVELPPFAVFTDGDVLENKPSFELTEGGEIIGDVGVNNKRKNSMTLDGGAHVDGDVYVPNGDTYIINNKTESRVNIKALDTNYTMPILPPFPSFPEDAIILPDQIYHHSQWNKTDLIKDNVLYIVNYMTDNYTLEMRDDLYFKEIEINENNVLNINTGNEDRKLVVGNLNMINGHIKLKGKGNVTIYVEDDLTMGSSSSINQNDEPERVNIFYQGENKFKMAGDQSIFGSLYAQNANIDLGASGSIHGNIFSNGKKVILSGGSHVKTQLILAPQAYVNIIEGGNITGTIMANSFSMNGGGKVTYDPSFIIDGPISLEALNQEDDDESSGDSNQNEEDVQLKFSYTPVREVVNE